MFRWNKGKPTKFFDAKSTIDRKIIVQLQRNGTSDNNWDSYFYQEVELTNELKTFKYELQ